MIYASDFRKGRTFQINGEPHVVLDFLHVKPGKGAAFVRTKYRNIITGATREEAFNPDEEEIFDDSFFDEEEEKPHRRTKRKKKQGSKKSGKVVKIVVGAVVGVAAVVYLGFSVYFMNHFYFNTKINMIITNNSNIEPIIIKILLFRKPFLFILFSKLILNISLSAWDFDIITPLYVCSSF